MLPWLYTVVRNACTAMLRPIATRLRVGLSDSQALDVADEALAPEGLQSPQPPTAGQERPG